MHDILASDITAVRSPNGAGRGRATTVLLAAAAGLTLLGGLSSSMLTRSPAPVLVPGPAPVTVPVTETEQDAALPEAPAVEIAAPVRETAEASGTDAESLPFPAPDALRAVLNQPAPTRITDFAMLAPFMQPEADRPAAESAPSRTVPIPVPRPSEFQASASPRAPRTARRLRAAAAPAQGPAEDDRNFFEKFFGIERQAAPALAYAALETSPSVEMTPRRPLVSTPSPVPPPAASGSGVAVYDITAKTVTLPNGERLEAHSGLGAYMDDPRYVHEKMRGPTPPGTYDLTEREALFHNVRAIRLTPVGGSEAVHNRVGLLAHTFMLGPQGASNGCVSFRDYNRFLQAYLAGQVQRLVVVAGARGSDPISSLFASR